MSTTADTEPKTTLGNPSLSRFPFEQLGPNKQKKRQKNYLSLVFKFWRHDSILSQYLGKHLGHGRLKHQPLLVNDWVKMKVQIPKVYFHMVSTDHLARLFTWLLLAGFIVLPVTFTSLHDSNALKSIGKAGKVVSNVVENIPILVIAWICFGFGIVGVAWLWWVNSDNFIWLTDQIFLPALLNAATGLMTTVINVYGSKGGHWSITALVTAYVSAFVLVVTLVLYKLYVGRIKPDWKEHVNMNPAYVHS
ncbi:hypothetical protein F5884DRAFT_890323 [Xylogone sp. PMI_703]|nr:hypothetical protein F5884DRAFT_890323 [Xylogone sp. PMI_703]